jgi:hypothetical protein
MLKIGEKHVRRYTVYVEITDRMSDIGVSGPYPCLRTDDAATAFDECALQNCSAYVKAWVRDEVEGVNW